MPIVTIRGRAETRPEKVKAMIREVRRLGAEALSTTADNLWVEFHPYAEERYLQKEDPREDSPVVMIHANEGRTGAMKKNFAAAVTDAVGRGLDVDPKRVWLHYQEVRLKDIWYGGGWSG